MQEYVTVTIADSEGFVEEVYRVSFSVEDWANSAQVAAALRATHEREWETEGR